MLWSRNMLLMSWRCFKKFMMMKALTTAAEKFSNTAHKNMNDSCRKMSRSFDRQRFPDVFVYMTGTPSTGTHAIVPVSDASRYGRSASKIAHWRVVSSPASCFELLLLIGGHCWGTPSICTTTSCVSGDSIPTENRMNHSTGSARKASVDKTCQDPSCKPGPCTQTRAIHGADVKDTFCIQSLMWTSSSLESLGKPGCLWSSPEATLTGAVPCFVE
mmetsp:Transcript_40780/g.93893  ORF Transcript_40780/g.93893 Transcript_40780/m.93893 type:complete len:216 (-) Transcript_40780:857-1504(-)